MDADTKLIPAFRVGKRDVTTTRTFLHDLKNRMKNRIQLSSDGALNYIGDVEDAFGMDVDYGMVVKTFHEQGFNSYLDRRYSPATIIEIKKKVISGDPDWDRICTNHLESHNRTLRNHVRRLVRMTPCFSKKMENLRAAVGLFFAYYNFCRTHTSIRVTPAIGSRDCIYAHGVFRFGRPRKLMTYLDELKATIERSEKCSAKHIATVPVTEIYREKTIWEGEVEVFELTGHAKAQKAYAWGYPKDTGRGWVITTVLEIPPVVSPQTAVKAAIVADAKSKLRAGK
jgi:IS1 family transposase